MVKRRAEVAFRTSDGWPSQSSPYARIQAMRNVSNQLR